MDMRSVLEIVLILLLASVVLLFFLLITHKLGTDFRDWKRRRLKTRYAAYLRKFLLGRDGTILYPRGKLAYATLSSLCIERLESSSREDRALVQHYIRGARLVEYYRKRAGSSSLPKRFHAIKTLGYFALDELKPEFTGILEGDEPDEIKGAAVWALSRIADEEVLARITQTLSADISLSSKFNEYVFSNVIRSFKDKDITGAFIAFLKKLKGDRRVSPVLKRDVIEACGACGLVEASRPIVDLFFAADDQPAIKIACMRALGRLECEEYAGVVTSALFHNDWRVRSQAAQAASGCRDSAVPQLRLLLYDDYYYVRINAARSLLMLGQEGLSMLRSERDSDDPFVRDTVRFMLRE